MIVTHTNRTPTPPPRQAPHRSCMVIYPALHPQYSHMHRLYSSWRSTFPSLSSLPLFCFQASEYPIPFSWHSPLHADSSFVSPGEASSGPSSGVLLWCLHNFLDRKHRICQWFVCFLSSPLNPQVGPGCFIFHCKPLPASTVSGTKLMLTKLTAWLSEQTRNS